MLIFDTYGIAEDDMDEVTELLAETLAIQWVPHESYYLGEYYRWGSPDQEEELVLQHNYREPEDEWMLPQFREFPILLYITSRRSGR